MLWMTMTKSVVFHFLKIEGEVLQNTYEIMKSSLQILYKSETKKFSTKRHQRTSKGP